MHKEKENAEPPEISETAYSHGAHRVREKDEPHSDGAQQIQIHKIAC